MLQPLVSNIVKPGGKQPDRIVCAATTYPPTTAFGPVLSPADGAGHSRKPCLRAEARSLPAQVAPEMERQMQCLAEQLTLPGIIPACSGGIVSGQSHPSPWLGGHHESCFACWLTLRLVRMAVAWRNRST